MHTCIVDAYIDHAILSYLTILLYQLGEVGKQWMMFPEKIKLVTPLFPLHQPLQE